MECCLCIKTILAKTKFVVAKLQNHHVKLKRKIMNEKRSNQILEKVSNMKKYNTDTQRAKKIEEEKRRKIMNK